MAIFSSANTNMNSNTKYIDSDYEHINDLVKECHNKNTDAALELIKIFSSFINKYKLMLKHSTVNYEDKDTRRFLALFSKHLESRKKLKSKVLSYEINSIAHAITEQLNYQLACIPEEDIEQDIIRIILLLVSRYEDKGKNFCAYLYNTFRYEMKRVVDSYVSDPINAFLEYDEADQSYEDAYLNIDNLVKEFEDELDLNWIQGLTCGDDFADVSKMDRMILSLYYERNYSEQKIADTLGVHRNTIFTRRTKAVKKIREEHNKNDN